MMSRPVMQGFESLCELNNESYSFRVCSCRLRCRARVTSVNTRAVARTKRSFFLEKNNKQHDHHPVLPAPRVAVAVAACQ